MLKAKDEFIVGKHDIGWIDSDFKNRFGGAKFEERALGAFAKLPRSMNGNEMITKRVVEECELGDVLALLKNPPEESKDGDYNLFVLSSFVVGVYWSDSDWRVRTWDRGGYDWGSHDRVFSPATVSNPPGTEPSDALILNPFQSELLKQVRRIANALEKKSAKKRK